MLYIFFSGHSLSQYSWWTNLSTPGMNKVANRPVCLGLTDSYGLKLKGWCHPSHTIFMTPLDLGFFSLWMRGYFLGIITKLRYLFMALFGNISDLKFLVHIASIVAIFAHFFANVKKRFKVTKIHKIKHKCPIYQSIYIKGAEIQFLCPLMKLAAEINMVVANLQMADSSFSMITLLV